MTATDTFIAQGLLPFVGREEELETILAFWRSIPESQRLRVMLLTAEAGVGKSRLLEEALRSIRTERGAVVHVKLYPEAATSLGSLLSQSIWKSDAGRDILAAQPGEHLQDVIVALQRLSRLRPTLLVLEDIHLFQPESIPDLIRLFEGIADETISVLCLSRPVSIPALGVLEPHLVESMNMAGLKRDALGRLWTALFSGTPPKGVMERLHSVTKGNALAVRSGLRAAVQSGALTQRTGSGEWTLSSAPGQFEAGLRRSVSLVTEGMVAHIGREERANAELLATLGEVFARETAARLLPEAEMLIAVLMENGLIVETFHPVSPLSGGPLTEPGKGWRVEFPASDYPLLAFTHSLLHAYLAERAALDVGATLQLIADDAPLYSLLPLRLLDGKRIPADADPSVLIKVIRRLSAIAVALDRTTNWQNGGDLLRPMFHILEHLESLSDVEEDVKKLWRMNAQHISLSILRREKGSPDWIAVHDSQMEITVAPETLLAAQYRLLAHTYLLDRVDLDKPYEEGLAIIPDLDDLLERFSELRADISYVYVLESLIQHAYTFGDDDTMREVQKRTERLFEEPGLGEHARVEAIRRILPVLLRLYSTPEELREREASIELIETVRDERDPYYGNAKVQFFGLSGRFHQALDLIDIVSRASYDRGLWSTVFVAQGWRLICEVGIGGALKPIMKEIRDLFDSIGDVHDRASSIETVANSLLLTGLLSGDLEEALEYLSDLGLTRQELPDYLAASVALWKGDARGCLSLLDKAHARSLFAGIDLLPLWKRIASDRDLPADDTEHLVDFLKRPVIQIYDVLAPRTVVLFLRGLSSAALPDELNDAITDATVRSLEWLRERHILSYMPPLTELLRDLGRAETAAEWSGKGVAKERTGTVRPQPTPQTELIRISMLGTIRVAIPPEEFAPIRGIRIRTLLGLMVADRMIGTPLTGEEFIRLSGGEESDPEHARKKKNMGVVRLREILGPDAIITEGPTPQLNDSLVEVDLLELHRRIAEASEAVRNETYVRAIPLIEEALALHGGDVPFPTLYEDFFEAAREDLEYRLRRCVVDAGRGMLEMGDAAGAEPFLRKAFDALPGDEEIADMLRRALEESGNRIEAERVRMRMTTTA